MISNTRRLAGKTVLITGASRGFGQSLAVKVAKDGANVVVLAKTTDPHPKLPGTIYETERMVKEAGGTCLPLQLDVRSEENVKAAVDKVKATFGETIDVLVNNASAMHPNQLEQLTTKRFNLMNDVILKGSFFMTTYCLDGLKKSENPHILNICPPITIKDDWFHGLNHLAVMKYALSLSTLTLALDLKKDGIAVNGLWPKTAFWSGFMSRAGGYTEALRKYCRKPEIMSDAAYVMLSKDSKSYSKNFVFDDDVLVEAGINNFDVYAEEPGNPLIIDIFVEDGNCRTFQPLASEADALKMLKSSIL